MRFDFNEANILKQTLFDGCSKAVLLSRLNNLASNTKESVLQKSVFSLMHKIDELSESDLQRIYYDIQRKQFVVTSHYRVLHKRS